MSKTVLVPIADGTEEIEAVCVIDTLRRGGAQVTVASVMDGPVITASRGVKLQADVAINGCADQVFDAIVMPGGLPGAEHLRDSAPLTALLKAQAAAGRLYAAICAAPVVVLQHHGLLEGKRATCHGSMTDELTGGAADGRVVADGNCITSQGPGTAIEFALAVLESLFGADRAATVAAAMHVSR